MKQQVTLGVATLASALMLGGLVLAQATDPVQSLRGSTALTSDSAVPEFYQQQEGREVRNYRQQPPVIPHTIDAYQIDLRTNQCLSCHDWSTAGERGAPTLSMTHYQDRDGHQLDSVAGTRWFCNQCHVPQADAPALVGNVFRASDAPN